MRKQESPLAGGQSSNQPSTHSIQHCLDSVNIAEVWTQLGGGPLRHGRGQAFWRGGDGFNVVVNAVRGRWTDFATNQGGGILDLVEVVLGVARRDAWRWLEARGFVARRERISGQLAKLAKQQREQAGRTLRFAELWRRGKSAELERQKAAAFYGYDLVRLARASRELVALNALGGAALTDKFLCERAENPAVANFLLAQGFADERHAEMLAWLAIDLISCATPEGEVNAA